MSSSRKTNHRRLRLSQSAVLSVENHTIPDVLEGASLTHSIRNHRIEHLLLEELRSILGSEVSDPHAHGIWPVSVQLTPDGSHAKISYAVRTDDVMSGSSISRRCRDALKRATGFIRARLASSLNLKRTPHLSFVFLGLIAPLASFEGDLP